MTEQKNHQKKEGMPSTGPAGGRGRGKGGRSGSRRVTDDAAGGRHQPGRGQSKADVDLRETQDGMNSRTGGSGRGLGRGGGVNGASGGRGQGRGRGRGRGRGSNNRSSNHDGAAEKDGSHTNNHNSTKQQNDGPRTSSNHNRNGENSTNNKNKDQRNDIKKPNGRKNRSNSHKDQESKKNTTNNAAINHSSSTDNPAKKRSNKARTKKVQYEQHLDYSTCLARYTSGDPTMIRGKIRVMPARNGAAFVTCDRGSVMRDILVKDEKHRNRALDGDHVFVELLPLADGHLDGDVEGHDNEVKRAKKDVTIGEFMANLDLNNDVNDATDRHMKETPKEGVDHNDEDIDVEFEEEEYLIEENSSAKGEYEEPDDIADEEEDTEMWHDDEVQMRLWDPVVNLRKKSKKASSTDGCEQSLGTQRTGKVIYIIPPKSNSGKHPSELNPGDESYRNEIPSRTIVGCLTKLPDGDRYLFVPNNKSLPRFMCPQGTKDESNADSNADSSVKTLYRAEYIHGSWHATNKWPPCVRVTSLCGSCNVEDETQALLVEHGVDHGEFLPDVLRDVEESVKSGRFFEQTGTADDDMGWKPTEEMLRGRRDYRSHRVFTIDPTTARDLDDALHITPLPDGRVEIGVHIADVSHFIQPESAVDVEALRRATTVYLVDRVIPMLPRPLCEIACSLNENVERLAFSVVWRMNMDGTLSKKGKNEKCKEDDIWYGRTVIKSCSRLDYATAQNIIDGKVANGNKQVDETLWPKSRQPTGEHTIDQVAADVRLMHKVAMARRQLRFENGALALNGIKLTFQLEDDGETPKLCAPYPIRDSNRLIEEFMLLANYLVAQRLITHAHGRALLRNHSPPIELGLQNVVDVSKESFNFDIDITNSHSLQESLNRLCRECNDELVVQCVTESLMAPMKPAEYIAAGELDEADWQHFALNIPYYTHFTSPIRRYPDVVVHRLLQATLDDTVNEFPQKQDEIHSAADHCNEKRMAAKKAQERSDRVFLSLFLKKNPIQSVLGVCLGVGEKTFTVFVPSLGMSTKVFLDEHSEIFDTNAFEDSNGKRKIVVRPKSNIVPGMQPDEGSRQSESWTSLEIGIFTKLEVSCSCKDQPPIDVRIMLVGPWRE